MEYFDRSFLHRPKLVLFTIASHTTTQIITICILLRDINKNFKLQKIHQVNMILFCCYESQNDFLLQNLTVY